MTGDSIRRAAGYAAALAMLCGPAVWATAAPPAGRSVAACPAGQYLDPKTFFCMPGQLPAAIDVAPGLSLPWQEQDVFGTPGEAPDPAHGTTVP